MFFHDWGILGLLTVGCNNPATKNTSAALAAKSQTDSETDTSTTDATPPVAPAIALAFSAVAETAITVNWLAAIDNEAAPDQLTYQAFYTAQSPDGDPTAEQVKATWTSLGVEMAATTSAEAAMLSPDTRYYFTVRVTDAAGNITVYPVASQATQKTISTITNATTTTSAGPSVALDTFSATSLNAAGAISLPFMYVPSAAGGTQLTHVLTEGGAAGITITSLTGNPVCTVAVTGLSALGGTLILSSCTGDGTLQLSVDEGTAEDSLGNLSLASVVSEVVTVDNTGPSIVSMTPATNPVNTTPTSIIVTFLEAVRSLSQSQFVLGGNCTTNPTKGSVVMSANNTVATMTLSGGTCTNTQALTVSIDPTAMLDTLGNPGTGSLATRTYTVSTVGPSASIGAPSATRISAGSPVLTMAFTYTASFAGGTALTGTLTSNGGGITVSGTPSCTVAVNSLSTSGGSILLSSCSGNGTFTVHVNAGTVKDALNNNSTVSSESATITLDNIQPTVSSTSPATSMIYSVPSSIALTFSEAVTAAADNFGFSGTCTAPTLSSVGGSGTATVTLTLSGGSCTNGQTLILTSALIGISDLAGNVGSGTNVVTLTYAVAKRIYVTHLVSAGPGGTNGTIYGNIGGISGTDSICATDSNKPNSSTYKALIVDDAGTRVACTSANCASSSASEHVGTWPLAANTAYVRADGTTAIGTTTSAGIFSFSLTNSISTLLSNSYALTGLNQDWTTKAGYTCTNWTDSSSSSRMQTGRLASADAAAVGYADFNCGQQRYLYCVEQ